MPDSHPQEGPAGAAQRQPQRREVPVDGWWLGKAFDKKLTEQKLQE